MRRRRSDTLSLSEARRMAIAAQRACNGADRDPRGEGARDRPRDGKGDGTRGVKGQGASRAHVRRLVETLGVVQIDSVNVLARAHTLPIYARLGVYDRSDLDHLAYGGKRRQLFEYWGHAASLLPVAVQPLLRWRMADAHDGKGIYPGLARFAQAKRTLIGDLRREIEQRGPSAVGDFASHANAQGGWWGWSDAKSALEWLFWTGQLTTVSRRSTFERLYDIPERVLPQDVLATPTPAIADAKRALIERAARALGVGTEVCLSDYFRLDRTSTRAALRDLVEEGTLREVTVEGWEDQAYVHTKARLPKQAAARALLAPFDPLVWHRGRAEMLFSARIRIELYTPKHKRTHGYYVLPFLLGDRVVGRVDLKADRENQTLQVLSAHCEPGISAERFASPLADEIHLMAHWLGLPQVKAYRRGDAADALRQTLRSR